MGTEPIGGGPAPRALGSRLPLPYATEHYANFVHAGAVEAVRRRLATPQRQQTLKVDCLLADLLSSMPMCFNLFGSLTDPVKASAALRSWWPTSSAPTPPARP